MRDTAKAASPYAMPINDFVILVTKGVGWGRCREFVIVLLRHNCRCNLGPSVSAAGMRGGVETRRRGGEGSKAVRKTVGV